MREKSPVTSGTEDEEASEGLSGRGRSRGSGLPEAEVDLEDFVPEDEVPLPVPGLRGQEAAGTGNTGRQAKRKGKLRCRIAPQRTPEEVQRRGWLRMRYGRIEEMSWEAWLRRGGARAEQRLPVQDSC